METSALPKTEEVEIASIIKKENLLSSLLKKISVKTVLVCLALVIIPSIIASVFSSILILSSYNLELRIINVEAGKVVENAEITVDGVVKGRTDLNGFIKLENINSNFQLKVIATGFKILEKTFSLSGITSTVRLNIGVNKAGDSILSGTFNANHSLYDFATDTLFINDEEVKINSKGEFISGALLSGNASFLFQSVFFKDIKTDISIVAGSNNLEDITLIPTGDIIGNLKSYIKGDLVNQVSLKVENISPNKITIDSNGDFKIIDLNIDRNYILSISAPNYNTREYSVALAQGENSVPDLRLVEEGRVYFLKGELLVSSDFDGANVVENYLSEEFMPFNMVVKGNKRTIYFQTIKDRIRTPFAQDFVGIPYSLDTVTGEITQLTENFDNLGDIFPSYNSSKLFSIQRENSEPKNLIVANLDGSNQKIIKEINDNNLVVDGKITSNGEYFYFLEQNSTETVLYRYSFEDEELIELDKNPDAYLFDVNNEGKLLFSRLKGDFFQLNLYNPATQTITILQEKSEGEMYKFSSVYSSDVIFYVNQNRAELKKIDTNTFTESTIITLTRDDKFSNLFEQNGLWFYQVNSNLFVIDVNLPIGYRIVSSL